MSIEPGVGVPRRGALVCRKLSLREVAKHTQGRIDFRERKNWTLAMLCKIMLGAQIQNLNFEVDFQFGTGSQKSLTITPKSAKKFFLLTLFYA